MIELETLEQLPIADWAKVEGVCIRLFQVISALHKTLVPGAMSHAEHVA